MSLHLLSWLRCDRSEEETLFERSKNLIWSKRQKVIKLLESVKHELSDSMAEAGSGSIKIKQSFLELM